MSTVFHYGFQDDRLKCGLSVEGGSVAHSVNGWHDGLEELLDAACEMFGRTNNATVRFQEEPGEFRWRIERLAGNRLRIRVFEFSDWDTGLPDDEGILLFDQPCGAVAFGRAIYDGCTEWLAELEGLRRDKPPRFPQGLYDQLGGFLNRVDRQ